MSNEGLDILPDYHIHNCSECGKQFDCMVEDCDETNETAICEDCLEYPSEFEEDNDSE